MKNFVVKFLVAVLCLTIFSFGNHVSAASVSPKSDYYVYVDKESITLYDKPNGKKIGTYKGCFEKNQTNICNIFKAKKFVKNNWVQLSVELHSGEKFTGYAQTKYIRANHVSFDYAIINNAGLNLRTKPSTNSKVLVAIPYGTRVDINYDKNSTKDWYYVTYVTKSKTYKGYIYSKLVR